MRDSLRGTVLECDMQGRVISVLRDGLGLGLVADAAFSDPFDSTESGKARHFIDRFGTAEADFDTELIATVNGRPQLLHVAGCRRDGHLLIVAAPALPDMVTLFAHYLHDAPGHPQSPLVAGLTTAAWHREHKTSEHFDEMSRINNELTNLQRELARSNAELESRVRTRTAELEAARDLAETASAAKNRFLAQVSHDLRTPLNAILGFARILEREAPQRREIAAITDSGRQLLDMVNAMLEAAHGATGSSPAAALAPASPPGPRHRRRVMAVAPDQPECRVLIVEDEPLNRAVLLQLMRDTGFGVRVAADGSEGVDLFRAWRPHFIWMDMRMPVMDGVAATRAIRALPEGGTVKIAAFTAHACPANHDEILAAGCDAVLTKPIRDNELFEAMERLLGLRFLYADAAAMPGSKPR